MKALLDGVIEAVRQAGAMIRAEFHRPGGPRGGGDKAAIDVEVERFLRDRLLELDGDCSLRGEELGELRNPRNLKRWWVIDPQDGTAAFLAGYRGSSVAVALIEDREPVLGVVFSPTYPDDRGDLISWARGQQLQRWPGPLVRPPHPVTLVSQAGDDNVEANLECLAGGRYRTMPSVAYRFALVAAGEGTAGVSLSPTQAHDYAACHALLRAAELELYNQDGQPVSYDEQARSRSTWLFAGRQELSRRPWETVFRHRPQSTPLPYPVRARHRVSDPDRLSRLQGALLGQLVGDSLGSQTEFSTPDQIARDFPGGPGQPVDGKGPFSLLAGQPTDDSEMALCLARSLIEGTTASLAYQHWYESRPFDIGATTHSALKLGVVSVDSQANGSLMRCSPLALAYRGDQLCRQARLDSALTHANPLCGACCAAYLTALAAGLDGSSPEQALDRAYGVADYPVRALLDAALAGPPPTYLQQAGWIKIAFHNAFYQLMSGRALMEALIDTARQGGDADTNAAIAGALLGAFGGRQAVAPGWLSAVLTSRAHPKASGIVHPRPRFLWPCDALELAEQLDGHSRSDTCLQNGNPSARAAT